MKDGDTCPQCGGVLEEGITPGKVVCLSCRNEEIENDTKNWEENTVKKVYAFISWDDKDDMKLMYLCKTKELAEKMKDNYIKHVSWVNTKIQEFIVYDSLEGAEGYLI